MASPRFFSCFAICSSAIQRPTRGVPALALLGLGLSLAACSSDETLTTAVETLAPSFIPFSEGEPASAFWSASEQQLFIADNLDNRVWRWSDADGLVEHATTPDPDGALAAGATLVGQVIELRDGTLLVARFGQPGGGFSAIAWLSPDGRSGLVPNVDANQKHLGLVEAPDGSVYGSSFGRAASGMGQAGSVLRIDLEQGESVVASGFGKLVGLVVLGDSLLVSDQSAGVIYAAPLGSLPAQASEWTVFAELPVPDQLCLGPDGSFFSGQFQASPDAADGVAIRQIGADGSVSRFASDPAVAKPSGLAYDPGARRLFATDTGNVAQIGVHVFPVP